MPIIRSFNAECDFCGSESDPRDVSLLAIQYAKHEGFHIYGSKVICPKCWAEGRRYDEISKDVANA